MEAELAPLDPISDFEDDGGTPQWRRRQVAALQRQAAEAARREKNKGIESDYRAIRFFLYPIIFLGMIFVSVLLVAVGMTIVRMI